MVEDIVRTFGFLTLGTRLKRIGERLQADTQQIIDEVTAPPLQASQYPFLAAIDRLGPLSIGELAEAVGITQPGATRSLTQLVKLGVCTVRSVPTDRRRKIASLTKRGQRLVDEGKR